MSTKFNMALDEQGNGAITIFLNGKVEVVDDSHPNFLRISDALVRGEDVEALLSIEAAVTRIDDRVSIVDGVLYFDGEPVHNSLTNTIVRYAREDRDTTGLVKFMERLEANPSRRSREQLFNWTQSVNLTIDEDGYIVGYKGVSDRTSDRDFLDEDGEPLFPLEDFPYRSSNSGHAIVNGHDINGVTPAGVGAVIEMPREEVQDDPNQGCSFGLHVGNYSYAVGYSHSGALLEVRFDPADVVSVPADCSFQKLRCCRYEIVGIHEIERGDDLSDYEPEAGWDDDDAVETLSPVIPATFLDRLRAKFRKDS